MIRWKSQRKLQRGFTLIECLVATFILGVGVIGVAGMFACASLSERKAAYLDQAREIAEQTIEQVRAGSYAGITGPSGVATIPTPGLPHSTGLLAWEPYPDSASDQGLKLVALNLSWDAPGPSAGKYYVITLVYDPEEG